MGTTLTTFYTYYAAGASFEVRHGGAITWKPSLADEYRSAPEGTVRLMSLPEHQNEYVGVEFANCLKLTVSVTYLLPVLRSFADLCTPLEDGTVPLLHLLGIKQGNISRIKAGVHNGDVCHEVYLRHILEPVRLMDIAFPGNLKHWQVDYLRRHHFAVGLSPEQYIRKQS